MGKTKTKVLSQTTTEKPEKYENIFDLIKVNGNFYIGVAGKVVTKATFATAEEAKAYINAKPWDLIINTTCLCMDLSSNKS